jgi:hypothetical protein
MTRFGAGGLVTRHTRSGVFPIQALGPLAPGAGPPAGVVALRRVVGRAGMLEQPREAGPVQHRVGAYGLIQDEQP